MLTDERRKIICEMLDSQNAVSTVNLSKKFNVSIETIRKDLLFLENNNKLSRVHGGAMALTTQRPNLDYEERLDDNVKGKQELSRLAAMLVHNGDIISIDSGSTAIEFIKALMARLDTLTIITNSIDIFEIARNYKHFNILLCGGYFMREENAFYGTFTLEMLESIHVNKTFLFPSTVSLENGICSYHEQLYEVQKKYLKTGDEIIILADSGKFEKSAMLKLCDMNEKYTYVTDSGLGKEIKEIYKNNNIKIITSEDDLK